MSACSKSAAGWRSPVLPYQGGGFMFVPCPECGVIHHGFARALAPGEPAAEGYAGTVERVHLPSHVRRGRLSVDPVWHVTTPTGDKWQFRRRRDARAFIASGFALVAPDADRIEQAAQVRMVAVHVEAEGSGVAAVLDALSPLLKGGGT